MGDSSLYESSSTVSSSGDTEAVYMALGIVAVVSIIAYIINAIFMGMVFKKAGVPAWKAWVPVYNGWTFLELGGQKGWLVLLALIPIVNFVTVYVTLVFMIIAAYKIGLNFGKEAWFVAIYILLGTVWMIWLAFDKTAVWNPAAAGGSGNDGQVPPSAPTQPTTV